MAIKFNLFTILYIVFSSLSLFFIDRGLHMIELVFKLLSLISLSFLYLEESKAINIWYLLVILSSIVSDALFVFDDDFLMLSMNLLLLNRFFYIMIKKDVLKEISKTTLFKYSIPFFIFFLVIFPLFRNHLKSYFAPVLIIGLLSTVMTLLAFINYLRRITKKNKFFFLGLLLIVFSDVLIAYNKFIDYNFKVVLIYSITYYVARFLICNAMIVAESTDIKIRSTS